MYQTNVSSIQCIDIACMAYYVNRSLSPLSCADYYKGAMRLLHIAACNDTPCNEPLKQIMTVPIRQIMNQSVWPYQHILLRAINLIAEVMKEGTPLNKLKVEQIMSLLLKVNIFGTAACNGNMLSTPHTLLAQEVGKEVTELVVKASTTQAAAKITAKAAANQAGKSALLMGNVVDTVLLVVYTYRDYRNKELTWTEFQKRLVCNAASAIGSTAMGAAGAAAGAAIGTLIFPGAGTAIGAILENIFGGLAGSYIARRLTSVLNSEHIGPSQT